MEDSNLRRLSQQIYSLPHLTALETPREWYLPFKGGYLFIQKNRRLCKGFFLIYAGYAVGGPCGYNAQAFGYCGVHADF